MTDAAHRRLALVHTVAGLVPRFRQLAGEMLPEVETFDIVDETLLRDATREGRVSLETARRLFAHLAAAEAHGADAILVTCSSMGNAVDAARPFAGVPIVRVDQAMAERAVERGTRIGVLATLWSTLKPTAALIERVAADRERGRLVDRRRAHHANPVQPSSRARAHARDAGCRLSGDRPIALARRSAS